MVHLQQSQDISAMKDGNEDAILPIPISPQRLGKRKASNAKHAI